MNSIQEYEKLRDSIREYQGKIPKLKNQITEMTRAQLELDEEALKAEILEERGWEKKKEKAKENRAKIPELKAEIQKAEKALEILGGKLKKLRPAVVQELKKKHRPGYEQAIKEYAKKLKVAAEAEKEIAEKLDEADTETRRLLANGTGPVFVTFLPAFQQILTGGPFRPLGLTQYEHFRRDCEEQGISID
jgi:chromosome segregation ATPase